MSRTVDAATIAELFDRHSAALELYASRHTTAPQDCVQEAFVELARQTSVPTDPVAWLFRVVRHRAFNDHRAAHRRARREETAAELQAARHHAAGDPEGQVALIDLLRQLTDRQHEIVVLRIWGQLTWQEIAHVMGGSRSAAQREYVHALTQLRKHLEPQACATTTQKDDL